MKRLGLLALLSVVLLVAGCYTVPETGRSAFNIVPVGEELSLGQQEFLQIKKKEKISQDPAHNARVQRVGERIAKSVGNDLPSAKWEFVVFESKDVNAFALPGGKVGVYTALLRLAESDDELAVVMGHEIGHVTARHGAERMSQGLVAGLIGAAVSVGTENSRNRDLWRIAYGLGAAGTMLAFSRHDESEADYIGIRYAARAGYDPHAAVSFWKKMAQQAKGPDLPVFMRTHPSDDQRIANLQRWIPQVMPIYEQAHQRYQ
jgi:predicted Zn-dependent protease